MLAIEPGAALARRRGRRQVAGSGRGGGHAGARLAAGWGEIAGRRCGGGSAGALLAAGGKIAVRRCGGGSAGAPLAAGRRTFGHARALARRARGREWRRLHCASRTPGIVDKTGRALNTRHPLRRAASDRGGVAERSKAADCKSADFVFEGSNPSPSTNRLSTDALRQRRQVDEATSRAGVAQW